MSEHDYNRRAEAWSDIQTHMPTLRDLAAQCRHITEFGVRDGNSTVAFLTGLPADGRLVSYDHLDCAGATSDPRWEFVRADTGTLPGIAPTDLLFIDTLHDASHVTAELAQAVHVRRWLVFHDTVLFGTVDESTGEAPGIMHAILSFMAEHPEWRVVSHSAESCGLLILSAIGADA